MLTFRPATIDDLKLYFEWANDSLVRSNSLNSDKIDFDKHVKWFTDKIENPNVQMYVFLNRAEEPVGQVLIEKKDGWIVLGQSVAKEHRGKKYSTEILTKSTDDYLKKYPEETIISVVKASNIPSLKMSVNSGFNVLKEDSEQVNVLVLKGFKQNDKAFIKDAKKYYDL